MYIHMVCPVYMWCVYTCCLYMYMWCMYICHLYMYMHICVHVVCVHVHVDVSSLLKYFEWFDCNHGDNIICYLCICFIICSSCIYMAVNFFPILSWTSRNFATQRSRHMASPFCKSASWYFGGIHFFWQATDNLMWILIHKKFNYKHE